MYSTCSLNPLEDEAVVAALLRRSKGALKLVDVSGELEGLRRRPGMYSWKVGDVFGWHDAPAAGGRRQRNVTDTMWPPGTSQARDMHLERCVRIMPHLDDTGGFFIVAIDKVAELPGDVEGGAEKTSDDDARPDGKGWNESNRVAPVIPVENDALVRSMREQYGVDDAAAGLRECLMTRRAGVSDAAAPKRLYYVSGGAKKLLAADGGGAGGLQVVSAGVKAFERQAAKGAACEYRVTQEGLDVLLPHLERQVVRAAPREIEAILARQQGQPQSAEAAKQDLLRPVDAPEGCWEKETLEAMKRVTPGCVVLVTRATREEGGGDEQPAKRAKKEKKEKKEKKDRRASGQGWSGWRNRETSPWRAGSARARRGRVSACSRRKQREVTSCTSSGSSSTKRDENLASLRWARSRAPRRVHTVDYAYPTKCSCTMS